MASYWFKIAKFSYPLSFRALDCGDPYVIFGKALQILKLESLGRGTDNDGVGDIHAGTGPLAIVASDTFE